MAAGSTAGGSGIGGASASKPTATAEEQREGIRGWVKSPGKTSWDWRVILTNLIIAGFTVWVLFSSVLLDQLMRDNRDAIDRRLGAFGAFVGRFFGLHLQAGGTRKFLSFGGIFLAAGVAYALVEPSAGLNRGTAVVFLAALIGVTVLTVVGSVAEAAAVHRWGGSRAEMRPYPAALAIIAVSATASRFLSLEPGVVYGFVASVVALGAVHEHPGANGRVALANVATTMALALLGWVVMGAVTGESFAAQTVAAVGIIAFVGGVESIILNVVPISASDGGKLLRWRRSAWIVMTLLATFLAWHVLIGRDRAYFSGLRETDSLVVIGLFAAYTTLTVGSWLYFRRRGKD